MASPMKTIPSTKIILLDITLFSKRKSEIVAVWMKNGMIIIKGGRLVIVNINALIQNLPEKSNFAKA